MKTHPLFVVAVALFPFSLAAGPALTIYNQNFAVVRETIPLDLKAGVNAVTFAEATLHLEPDSVVLRDPSGKVDLSILEQSYRADTLSQGLLLSLYEGQEIDFIVSRDPVSGKESRVRGKIIRSGYIPNTGAASRYGQQFYQAQQLAGNWQGGGSPIIEVDGQLRFSLPGEPVFPSVTDDAILKPQLSWQLSSAKRAKVDAELSYITGGMSWEAAYNLIAPEKGDTLDIVGWVTIDNQSGKTFDTATIKLMAGDVSKLQPQQPGYARAMSAGYAMDAKENSAVTEKAFDEFHLYSLPRPATLRNRETKQVEFLRAAGVKAATLYIYNGAAIDRNRYNGWGDENIRNDRDYGTKSNRKVWVMREFKNTKENSLGLPLPKGRTRFYRQDDADNRLEFTGENTIDHTPEGETVRIYTGDAFDVVGERKRTDYKLLNRESRLEEAFEITLRNRKKEPVEVRVTERLYRWVNWTIMTSSDPYVKTDARNVEFRVMLKPDEEKVITYRVGYDWN